MSFLKIRHDCLIPIGQCFFSRTFVVELDTIDTVKNCHFPGAMVRIWFVHSDTFTKCWLQSGFAQQCWEGDIMEAFGSWRQNFINWLMLFKWEKSLTFLWLNYIPWEWIVMKERPDLVFFCLLACHVISTQWGLHQKPNRFIHSVWNFLAFPASRTGSQNKPLFFLNYQSQALFLQPKIQ